eukprot:4361797-Pleurochrysis_carterae.AAC.2
MRAAQLSSGVVPADSSLNAPVDALLVLRRAGLGPGGRGAARPCARGARSAALRLAFPIGPLVEVARGGARHEGAAGQELRAEHILDEEVAFVVAAERLGVLLLVSCQTKGAVSLAP